MHNKFYIFNLFLLDSGKKGTTYLKFTTASRGLFAGEATNRQTDPTIIVVIVNAVGSGGVAVVAAAGGG